MLNLSNNSSYGTRHWLVLCVVSRTIIFTVMTFCHLPNFRHRAPNICDSATFTYKSQMFGARCLKFGRWPKNNDSKHRSPGKDAQNYAMPSSVASVVAEIKRGSPARRKLVEFSAVKLLLVHPVCNFQFVNILQDRAVSPMRSNDKDKQNEAPVEDNSNGLPNFLRLHCYSTD